MALEENCHTSSLIRNFADHTLSVLNITVHKPPKQPPWRYWSSLPHLWVPDTDVYVVALPCVRRVTMSHRSGVRKVVNDREMYDAMVKRVKDITPRFVDYAKLSWKEQLELSANTDLYIGTHSHTARHLQV